jgi:hypothetical protein
MSFSFLSRHMATCSNIQLRLCLCVSNPVPTQCSYLQYVYCTHLARKLRIMLYKSTYIIFTPTVQTARLGLTCFPFADVLYVANLKKASWFDRRHIFSKCVSRRSQNLCFSLLLGSAIQNLFSMASIIREEVLIWGLARRPAELRESTVAQCSF